MKICIAQSRSVKGDIQTNISDHLLLIERAIELKAKLIIFPELSITNYEPELAETLAINPNDKILNPFQNYSNQFDISIGVGIPTRSENGIHISMIIFQPNSIRNVYSKQLLHQDELPFFTAGEKLVFIQIDEIKIGIGICYETMRREHIEKVMQHNPDIYIASVSKSSEGVDKAHQYYKKTAEEYNVPILMSNAIGQCSGFNASGNSGAWNNNGNLLGTIDVKNTGLLFYETTKESISISLS